MMPVKDILGQVFGRLTVVALSSKRGKSGNAYWLCLCCCGNEKIISQTSLRIGETQSCGCLKLEKDIQRIKDYHTSRLKQTHCKRGHLFTVDNTYKKPSGQRSCKVCKRQRQQDNTEKAREANRASYKRHREKRLAHNRIYWKQNYAKNPEYYIAMAENYRSRKNNAPVTDFTLGEWKILLDEFGSMCAYCGEIHPKLTQDHMIPLSRGGSHTYENIVPACKSCNSRKHTLTADEFQTERL